MEALRLIEEDPSSSSEAVLAALEDDAPEVRAQAASSLVAARESRVVSNLLDLADARDPAEREAAVRALGRSGSPRAQPTLERALQDASPAVSIAAAEALASSIGEGAFDSAKLAPLLNAAEPLQRLAAVELLDALKDPAGLAARSAQLRKAAHDAAPEVRSAALRALGHLRDARWLADLQTGASDPDESVRLWAIAALGDSHLAAAVSALRARASGVDVRTAEAALAALGRIDDAGAGPAIAAQLTRAPLARSAADAIVTRARRLRRDAVLRESADALRRAIETAREDDVLGMLAGALVELTTIAAAESSHAAHSGEVSTAAPLAPCGKRSLQPAAQGGKGTAAATQQPSGAPCGSTQQQALAQAQRSLLQALERGRGDVRELSQSLLDLHEPRLLPALLARSDHAAGAPQPARPASPALNEQNALRRDTDAVKDDAPERPASAPQPNAAETLPERAEVLHAVIAAVLASEDAAALLAEHAVPLKRLADQPDPPPRAATSLVQLRSLLDLDTAEAERSPALRLALAELASALPALATPKHAEKLLAWLDDPDQRVRERSSIALARVAGAAELAALATRLEQRAPHADLTLKACAGALLHSAPSLPPPLRERLFQQLESSLKQRDEAVAMSALFALRASGDPRAARQIAALLRGSSAPLRAAALQALGDFDEQDARRLLRDTLRGDNIVSASSAALGLAELGSDRDVEALLRAAERGSWPLQPSAAYAAARITQRAQIRKHSLERSLCRFAEQRDSYAVANSASALAAIGASACSEPQRDPSTLLVSSAPSALRVAAAAWLRAAVAAERTQANVELLASCAEDHDPAVSRACSQDRETAEVSGKTLLKLYDDDGTPLRDRIVALRLPNASVFIGRSDSAGLLLLPRALRGEIVLEDPANSASVSLPRRTAPAESAENSTARSK